MKERTWLVILGSCGFLLLFACCSFIAAAALMKNSAQSMPAPTLGTVEPLVNPICENPFMPTAQETMRKYTVKKTAAGSVSTDTNYETILNYGQDYFSVDTQLGGDVGPALDEFWLCSQEGLTRAAFESGEFGYFFPLNEIGFSTRSTADWCPSGVTLPARIQPGDTWTQQLDFQFAGTELKGWNRVKWSILRQPLDVDSLPLPAGSGRFLYEYHAVGFEQIQVPAGTYDALRIDVTAHGYLDPSRQFSPVSTDTGRCRQDEPDLEQVHPFLSLTYDGSTWYAPGLGWVRKVGTLSNAQGEIESHEMQVESIGTYEK